MTFKYRYRKQIICVVLIVVIISSLSCFYYFNKKESKNNEKVLVSSKKVESKEKEVKLEKKKEEIKEIMVDVKGEVNNSGIYTLKEGSRVIDAINMAGGITSNADTSVLNLSKKLTDEMVIIVYSYYEVRNFERTKEIEKIVTDNCINSSSVKNDACIDSSTEKESTTSIISINTATVEELTNLPGVGEAKAKSIVDYREQNGLFEKVEDIKNVSGIGEALFEKIKDYITT